MNRYTAFRRIDFAFGLMEDGDLLGAVDAARAAIDSFPQEPQLHFVLGQILEKAERCDEAVIAYQKAMALQEEDVLGAGVRLSVLGAQKIPERLPKAYVEALFDDYAPRFERNLLKHLSYSAPTKLRDLVLSHHARLPRRPSVIDLGCGTGLMGQELAVLAARMDGLDLSQKMLRQAAKKRLYHGLYHGDIETDWPCEQTSYDLAVACDVLNYLGDLTKVFRTIAAHLSSNGLFAFSLESHVEETSEVPFELHEGHRYRHHRTAVLSWLSACGFELIEEKCLPIRMEKQQPVQAQLVMARLMRGTKEGFLGYPEKNDRSDSAEGAEPLPL